MIDPARSVSNPPDVITIVPGDMSGDSDLSNQPSNDNDDDDNNGGGDNS
jgi:hypothetical protein